MEMSIRDVRESMEDIKIKFDGDTHQIEANTLINSLFHFTNIVQEVNKVLDTGQRIEVKVNALPEGSFLLHITVQSIMDAAEHIFTKENLVVAKEIISGVKDVFSLYKFLKGRKPEKIVADATSTTVTNYNGDTVVFNNPTLIIYQGNRTIREAISQEFATLHADTKVTGFELLDENDRQLLEVDRSEFQEMANSNEEPIEPDERILPKEGMLSIYTLSFDPNIKWTFYYEGNKITAKISDDFILRIDQGEKFAKGDSLRAEFEIKQQFDIGVNDYINKSYRITSIIEHIPRSEQQKLDFEKGKDRNPPTADF